MINHVVTDLIDNTSTAMALLSPVDINAVRKYEKPMVGFSEPVQEMHGVLKQFLHENLYRHNRVRSMNERTKSMIDLLFGCYMADPDEMPSSFSEQGNASDADRARVVADYIAGMTDRFAVAEHERLAAK